MKGRQLLGKLFRRFLFFGKKKQKTPASETQTLSSRLQLAQSLDLPPIEKLDKNLISFFKSYGFEAQEFKKLRTNILFPPSGNSPHSVLITSVVPGEGSSFVTANLGISIAQNVDKKYALLIDCDLRFASLHQLFGYSADLPGLSEYLSEDIPLSSLLLNTRIDRLSLLPAGLPPPNPSELLSSARMEELLTEIKHRYEDRYTLIDAPPPDLMPETSVLARHVDGVLIVVQYGSTPKKQVEALIDTLGKDRILGLVLNWSDTRVNSYTPKLYRKHVSRRLRKRMKRKR